MNAHPAATSPASSRSPITPRAANGQVEMAVTRTRRAGGVALLRWRLGRRSARPQVPSCVAQGSPCASDASTQHCRWHAGGVAARPGRAVVQGRGRSLGLVDHKFARASREVVVGSWAVRSRFGRGNVAPIFARVQVDQNSVT